MSDKIFTPKSLREFFGQELIKKKLKIIFQKFERTQQFPPSIFIYGPIGAGKGALTKLITQKLGREIISISDIDGEQELIHTLLLDCNRFVFLFENIEVMPTKVQNLLVRIIKEKSFEILLGKVSFKIVLDDLVLIGTSARTGLVPKAIRENFDEVFHLEPYKLREIKKIILNVARRQKVDINNDAAWEIAHASRKSPQRAIKLFEKVGDFAKGAKKGRN